MSLIVVPRGMAENFACSGGGLGASWKPASRLQDKSTAVGRGVYGWFYELFTAGHHLPKLALPSKIPVQPSLNAPSPVSGTHRREPR